MRQDLIYTTHTAIPRLEAINNRMVYHDENGFRENWCRAEGEEYYTYSPDYRLLKVSRKDVRTGQELVIEFDHDQNGQRYRKFINGQSVEAYDWHDLIRLDAAATHGQDLSFHYNEGERVPYAATFNGDRLQRGVLSCTDQGHSP